MKNIKIMGVFIIFLLAVDSHFMYDIIPTFITSILFPVNESIWEHMKLLVTPVIIFSVLEYFIYKYKSINYNNFILSYFFGIILGIILYLLIYLPINSLFGYNTIFAISLLFVIYIFIEYISYYIMNMNVNKYNKILGIIGIICIYFIFYYFTYYTPDNKIFYDTANNGYGIIKRP